MKKSLAVLVHIFLLTLGLQAQSTLWVDMGQNRQFSDINGEVRERLPEAYQSYSLDFNALLAHLAHAPTAPTTSFTLELPTPAGELVQFLVWEYNMMEPGLQAKFPEIKTYKGKGLENSSITTRFTVSPQGIKAIIGAEKGAILLAPQQHGQNQYYMSFYQKAYPTVVQDQPLFICDVHEEEKGEVRASSHDHHTGDETHTATDRLLVGDIDLHRYRAAIACTGEFAFKYGGTVSGAMAEIVDIMNKVNFVTTRDVAVEFTIVDDNEEIIFLDALDDPYTNGNTGIMINENPPVLANKIGNGNFDIGHVFGTNAGGLAGGNVCTNNKARGVSCQFGNYFNEDFYIIVAHEMGHQFSAQHTFNFCDGNENGGTAYEPGSGNTIMSYSGAGCAQWNQPVNDPFYHINSVERMMNWSRLDVGQSCADINVINNNLPVVETGYESGFYIPKRTPFEMTGISSDPEGDNLVHTWEQYDLGPQIQVGQPPQLTAPCFKFNPPASTKTRIFPSIDKVVANDMTDLLDYIPDYGRVMTFRFTARDNNPLGGAANWDEMFFNIADDAGPFQVTLPNNSAALWTGGETALINWNVANSDQAPVNCKFVDIFLSLDGGFTYPITLATGALNSGEATIVVPDISTTSARVKIKGSDNIFFDISNQNFTVEPGNPGVFFQPTDYYQKACIPGTISFGFEASPIGGVDSTLSLSVISGLPANAVASFSNDQIVPPGNSTLDLDLSNVTDEGLFEVVVQAVGNGVDTMYRTVFLETVYTIFDGFAQDSPADGTSGVALVTSYEWSASPFADYYDLQVSSHPTFDSMYLVEEELGLTTTSFNSTSQLDENQIYFWRVRAINECIVGDWPAVPLTFHTIALSCSEFVQDLPVDIPATGTPTVFSPINITVDGIIDVLKIGRVKGNHNTIKEIDVSIISPTGKEVILWQGFACAIQDFDLSFDMDAVGPLTCVFPLAGAYVPQGDLTDFNGDSSLGEWRLKTVVNNNIGNGGEIDEWSLEFCANVNLNPPVLINKDTLRVYPNSFGYINGPVLLAEDPNNTAEELIYTIVTYPEHGVLLYDNDTLQIGDQFDQGSVHGLRVTYHHTGNPLNIHDVFYFTLQDGEGGWIPPTEFNILIDENSPVVSTSDLDARQEVLVYPNPADQYVLVQLFEPVKTETVIQLFDMNGRLVISTVIGQGQDQIRLETQDLATGLYVVRTDFGEKQVIEKIIIE